MARKKERPGLMMWIDIWDPLLQMPDEKLGGFFRAALEYMESGVVPHFSGSDAVLWAIIRSSIDRDEERYQAVSEARRRAAQSRWAGVYEADAN